MNNLSDIVKSCPLFQGIAIADFEKMLACLGAQKACYKKDEIILLMGDPVSFVGIIVTGSVKVIKEDMEGNILILTELAAPELFAEVFACAGIRHSPVTVQAAEDCELLFIDYPKIINHCSAACPFHTRLIENMLRLIAGKNLRLNQKIEILSKRTIREKLLCYFDTQRGAAKAFAIPFNREELAHYLCVDRSAMSHELGKMRDEGLIRFKRNEFELFYL